MMKDTFADFVSHSITNAYILKWRTPVKCNDYRKWFLYFLNMHNTRVRFTQLKNGVCVSTVFLVLDHGIHYNNKINDPLLFETMVWVNDKWLDNPIRCSTWRKALLMHSKTVAEWRVLQNEENRNG